MADIINVFSGIDSIPIDMDSTAAMDLFLVKEYGSDIESLDDFCGLEPSKISLDFFESYILPALFGLLEKQFKKICDLRRRELLKRLEIGAAANKLELFCKHYGLDVDRYFEKIFFPYFTGSLSEKSYKIKKLMTVSNLKDAVEYVEFGVENLYIIASFLKDEDCADCSVSGFLSRYNFVSKNLSFDDYSSSGSKWLRSILYTEKVRIVIAKQRTDFEITRDILEELIKLALEKAYDLRKGNVKNAEADAQAIVKCENTDLALKLINKMRNEFKTMSNAASGDDHGRNDEKIERYFLKRGEILIVAPENVDGKANQFEINCLYYGDANPVEIWFVE